VKATEFEDTNFGFGTTYYYAITTVGSLQQPPRESLLSDALTVATKDVFPPAPPSDFTAIIQGNTAILFWAPSPSADVEGYRIFRKEKGSADQRIVQSELIRALSFRDTPVDPAKQYEYEIQAVDVYGNAGPAVSVESEQR
jgi:fibronectin type 3 domain-containing protein